MKFSSTVQHRMLINYRVDPVVARSLVPTGMRPQLVDGSAVAGICHIQQNQLRPAWLKLPIGLAAESSAHRIAVEWDDATGTHSGVYVAERHSSSPLVRLAGGRLVPGVQKRARFRSSTGGDLIHLELASPATQVTADVELTDDFHSELWGDDLHAASEFSRCASIGWSPSREGTLEALEIDAPGWNVVPATALRVESSYFDALPAGSAVLDCVLVLRNVPFNWSIPERVEPVETALAH
jgi:hypothetical protein